MNFLYIIGFVFMAILIGLGIYWLVLHFKEEEKPEDSTLFECFMKQYSDGYSKGTIMEFYERDNKVGIRFMPRDVNFLKFLKHKFKIEPQLVCFKKNQLEFFPKGTKSNHRNEIWGFPPTIEDLPAGLSNNKVVLAIMQRITKANIEEHEIAIARGETERIKEIDRRDYSKDFLEKYLEEQDEFQKDLKKAVLKEEKKFPTPT